MDGCSIGSSDLLGLSFHQRQLSVPTVSLSVNSGYIPPRHYHPNKSYGENLLLSLNKIFPIRNVSKVNSAETSHFLISSGWLESQPAAVINNNLPHNQGYLEKDEGWHRLVKA